MRGVIDGSQFQLLAPRFSPSPHTTALSVDDFKTLQELHFSSTTHLRTFSVTGEGADQNTHIIPASQILYLASRWEKRSFADSHPNRTITSKELFTLPKNHFPAPQHCLAGEAQRGGSGPLLNLWDKIPAQHYSSPCTDSSQGTLSANTVTNQFQTAD